MADKNRAVPWSSTTDNRMKLRIVFPLAIAAAACAVPWMMGRVPEFAFALQHAFALVCHQQPERSFFLFGGSVAVCARCLGIYVGAAIGLLIRIQRRVAMQLLFLAVFANAADWFAEITGLHSNWIHVRFVLGIALGTAAAMLVAASTTHAPLVPATSRRSGSIQRVRS